MANIEVDVNSYVTIAELEEYASDRGITIVATDKSILLIKAMDYLENKNYMSEKTVYNQALQFPRILCINGYYLSPREYDNETVPTAIKTAQIVAALLIDSGDDLQANSVQAIKSERVDVLETVYQDNTSSTTRYTQLDNLLRPFLDGGIRGKRV